MIIQPELDIKKNHDDQQGRDLPLPPHREIVLFDPVISGTLSHNISVDVIDTNSIWCSW